MKQDKILILGIESSCDDTGIALLMGKPAKKGDKKLHFEILSERLSSQILLHRKYGGVVPELASREHLKSLLPLTQEVFGEAKVNPKELSAIGVTTGPGLSGSLLTGASFASGLSESLDCPMIPINHLEGHVLSVLFENSSDENEVCIFPFLALLISGGHTQMIRVDGLGKYKLIGQTVDDSVGETFDKTALILGQGYPGGPAISKLAVGGNKKRFNFPRPLCNKDNLNFSFSGLKTSVQMESQKHDLSNTQVKKDIAACLESTISEILTFKCKLALKKTGLARVALSGGVASNDLIREKFIEISKETGIKVFFPTKRMCTDNGVMIAWAAMLKYTNGFSANNQDKTTVRPRWPLTTK